MKRYDFPDKKGHFGVYGGRFVSDTLFHALEALEKEYETAQKDPDFIKELHDELTEYVGNALILC